MADLELPITAHLEELRKRLSRVLLAIVVGFALCYPNTAVFFDLLSAPLHAAAAGNSTTVELIGTGVAEAFFTRLKVAFFAAILVTLPVSLHQLWLFVVPGLHSDETRYAKYFVTFGTLFFLAGSWFCYRIVLPFAFPFFLSEFAAIGIEPVLRISEYLSFLTRLLLAFGVTFEMPVATFFLARAGVVTHQTLIGYGRYAILVMFVVAAILTPPDAVSQLLMVGPLMLLYGLSVGVAWLAHRDRGATTEEDSGGE